MVTIFFLFYFFRWVEEGDVVQSPYGDALIKSVQDSGIGVNKYLIEVFDTGKVHSVFHHQLFPIEVLDDFTKELVFDDPFDEVSDDDGDNDDIEFWLNEISCDDYGDTENSDTFTSTDIPRENPGPSTSFDTLPSEPLAACGESETQGKKRFVQPDTLTEVQRLADERKARETEYQTRWAVKIFRGNCTFVIN